MALTTTTGTKIKKLAAQVMEDGWFNWEKDGRRIHQILTLLLPSAPKTAKGRSAFLVDELIRLDGEFKWKMAKKTQVMEEDTYRQFVSLWLGRPDVREWLNVPPATA